MRIVVITGAASGIGRVLAQRLVARGDHVVLADIVDARGTAAALSFDGPGTAEAVRLDVRDGEAFEALIARIVGERGGVDLLFNNAGIGVGGPVEGLSRAHWDRVIDVNLRGVANGVAAAYPRMVARGSGHIVNTASLAGLIPAPFLTPYAATKFAVVGLSLSLRAEAEGTGVRVTVVCPGFTDTPLLDSSGPADLPVEGMEGTVRRMAEQIPGGVYDVEKLADDILRGVDRNEAMVVAPRTARLIWRTMRAAPRTVVRRAAGQAIRVRNRLLSVQ